MNALAEQRIGWASTVGVHAGRLLRHWTRSPVSVMTTVAMPVMMTAIMKVMFSGMVERFSGASMNVASLCVMVAVSQAFIAALVDAGNIVQERHAGLPDRLATVPGPRFAGMAGRIVAASVISFVSTLSAVVVGLALGADFGSPAGLLGTLMMLAVVSVAAGSVGVMLGFLVDTPQGAMSFVPLVMMVLFFNTAMMPRNLYAAAVRPLVDVSPVTAVIELMNAFAQGRVTVGVTWPFVIWFGVLIALAAVVLVRRASRIQR